MESYNLFDQVVVYNFKEEADKIMNIIKDYDESEWGSWGSFGKMARLSSTSYTGNPKFFSSNAKSENPYNHEITTIYNDLFGKVTNDYIERHGLKIEQWSTSENQLCFYKPKRVRYTNLIMAFHTDFKQEQKHQPGLKHILTANFYINDDYEGGHIIFMIDDDENNLIRYKPKAGDLIVFPSGERFRHGVRTVDDGKKYFIRSFWHYQYDGSPEWHEEKAKYSEEEWSKKENLRERIERNSYMKWMWVD
jgi:hypothetical protein